MLLTTQQSKQMMTHVNQIGSKPAHTSWLFHSLTVDDHSVYSPWFYFFFWDSGELPGVAWIVFVKRKTPLIVFWDIDPWSWRRACAVRLQRKKVKTELTVRFCHVQRSTALLSSGNDPSRGGMKEAGLCSWVGWWGNRGENPPLRFSVSERSLSDKLPVKANIKKKEWWERTTTHEEQLHAKHTPPPGFSGWCLNGAADPPSPCGEGGLCPLGVISSVTLLS